MPSPAQQTGSARSLETSPLLQGRQWFKATAPALRSELERLPRLGASPFVEELARSPDQIGQMQPLALAELVRGADVCVPRFRVYNRTTRQEQSYEWVTLRQGRFGGTCALVAVTNDAGVVTGFLGYRQQSCFLVGANAPSRDDDTATRTRLNFIFRGPEMPQAGGEGSLPNQVIPRPTLGMVRMPGQVVRDFGELHIDRGMTDRTYRLAFVSVSERNLRTLVAGIRRPTTVDPCLEIVPCAKMGAILRGLGDGVTLSAMARALAAGLVDPKALFETADALSGRAECAPQPGPCLSDGHQDFALISRRLAAKRWIAHRPPDASGIDGATWLTGRLAAIPPKFYPALYDLSCIGERCSGEEVLYLERLQHANFALLATFKVRRGAQTVSVDVPLWNKGAFSGYKGIVLTGQADAAPSHFVVIQGERFSSADRVYDCAGGFGSDFAREVREELGLEEAHRRFFHSLGRCHFDPSFTFNEPGLVLGCYSADPQRLADAAAATSNADLDELTSRAVVKPLSALGRFVLTNPDQYFLTSFLRAMLSPYDAALRTACAAQL